MFGDELAQGKGHAVLGIQEVRSRLELLEVIDGFEAGGGFFPVWRNCEAVKVNMLH